MLGGVHATSDRMASIGVAWTCGNRLIGMNLVNGLQSPTSDIKRVARWPGW